MRLTIKRLRNVVSEAITASTAYLKREQVREQLQEIIIEQVKSGAISSDEDLSDFFKSVDMSVGALKMVPFQVYSSMANPDTKK
jgi:hypothetical protein